MVRRAPAARCAIGVGALLVLLLFIAPSASLGPPPTVNGAKAPRPGSPVPLAVRAPAERSGGLRPLPASGTVTRSEWVGLSGSPSTPEARLRAATGYDARDGYTVIFGGYDPAGSGWLGDTWTYARGRWTELSPTPAPAARSSAVMVWDANLSGLLLFGGYNYGGNTYYNDTWLFHAGGWTQLSTPAAPSPRSESQMAYDPALKAAILFGGWDGSNTLADTWEFTGTSWIPLHPASAPSGRRGAVMAWENTSAKVVLFSGTNSSVPAQLADTWTFSAGAWSEIAPGAVPDGRYLGAFAEAANGSDVLFGGGNTTLNSNLNDTWGYAGGTWYPLAPSRAPALREGSSLAFDARDGYLLLFGGRAPNLGTVYGDTWALDTLRAAWGTFNTSGTAPFVFAPTVRVISGLAPIQYRWDFGDGNVSNGSAPAHPYTRAGSYAVSLEVEDSLNVSVNLTTTVIVSLTVTLTASPGAGDAPLQVFLRANTSGATAPISYSWNFGDGTTGSTGPGTPHRFTTGGSYLVSVSLLDGRGARGNASTTVRVAPALGATLLIAPAPSPTASVGEVLTFTGTATGGTGPFTYAWSFGDGATATGSPATHVFAQPGNFTVRLTVVDGKGAYANSTSVVPVVPATHPPNQGIGGPPLNVWIALGLIATALGATIVAYSLLRRRRGRA